MQVEYIIVGLGLAGIAFAEELVKHQKSFVIFSDDSQQSSIVAGGVYNPVILKRFTPVWNATQQLEVALPYYNKLEETLQTSLDKKFVTKKVFKSVEDQNNWFAAIDKHNIGRYLDTNLDYNSYNGLLADYALGKVNETGRVDTKKLIEFYKEFLLKNNQLKEERFDCQALKIKEDQVVYQDFVAKKIVFSEGFGLKKNPFFNHLPLTGVKGETITIHAPDLAIDFQVKSTVFVLPLGNHFFKVGATFNWTDKTSIPTKEGKQELIEKLAKVINVPYEIMEHSAGVRPTTKDRRPLVGVHHQHKKIFVLNGLGTRGVMIAPTIAKELYQFIEHQKELNKEIDIKRFE